MLSQQTDTGALIALAGTLRDHGHGRIVSYSKKVFIPLTELCRDVCHYCTFAKTPRKLERAFMTMEEVLAVAKAGAEAGCKEALFTLGDKPELRYRAAREQLAALDALRLPAVEGLELPLHARHLGQLRRFHAELEVQARRTESAAAVEERAVEHGAFGAPRHHDSGAAQGARTRRA